MVTIAFATMVVLMILGVPIAFSIGMAGVVGLLLITGNLNMVLSLIGMTTFSAVSSYILLTLPMFVLMAFFSSAGGLAKDLFNAADKWLSHIRGGLAIGTVFACGIFGAMSGVSSASASVMSQIAIPHMRRFGYSETLAAGTVAVGATLDLLIPPSLTFVIYGFITGTSIGKLLLAGIVPGIILGIFLIICIIVWVTIRPQDAPETKKASWAERWQSLWHIWPSLLLIIVVLTLLYIGASTPTEIGATGAFIAGVIGICFGTLNFKSIVGALKATLRINSMIFMILIGTTIFSAFVALSGLPQQLIIAVEAMNLNRWFVIIGIVLTYFFLSMFMDELPLLLLTLQLTFPLIIKLGFDPIWFGVVSVIMVMMGLVFPPVGLLVFIVSATSKINLVKAYTGSSILMVSIVMTLIALFLWPEIALWLPSQMK
jgi:C4-dicarboxylate transporter DctM subunit